MKNLKSELAIGLVAPVGVDIAGVKSSLDNLLSQFKYKFNHLKLSKAFQTLDNTDLDDTNLYNHYNSYMTAGNDLRESTNRNDILALFSIYNVFSKRDQQAKKKGGEKEPLNGYAHIFDSLKHPDEAITLKDVYGPAFLLIGVYSSWSKRKHYLTNQKGMTEEEAESLIKRDKLEDVHYGQKTSEVFQLADAFINIDEDNYVSQITRILDLIFGHPYTTPTKEEFAMYVAYVSSWRSADLSRQVGAVITKESGEIIATGANDVPKYGGGLYWGELDNDNNDTRDYMLGYDSNERRKNEMILSIQRKFQEEVVESDDVIDNLIDVIAPTLPEIKEFDKNIIKEIFSIVIDDKVENQEISLLDQGKKDLADTGIWEITEYGRAVHAEMEALLSCVRVGVVAKNCTIYTTTFPCHNCAKHIIAAGIKKVVFIEPYPKSKAVDLHGDALWVDGNNVEDNEDKVEFKPFVGVGPRRFVDLFSMKLGNGYKLIRKEGGNTVNWDRENAILRVKLEPLSYYETEESYANILNEIIGE